MKKAIFAFSADPIHYGHINIIKRAAKKYDLTVAVGNNPEKDYLFSIKERLNLAKSSLKNIRIIELKGLLVDYAYENNINIIIKSFRNKDDILYEKSLKQAGDSQNLKIKTKFLKTKKQFRYISSTEIKALTLEQGDISSLVPLCVKQSLEKKLLNQYIIGITGEIASGKTHFAKKLSKNNIELDHIAHYILNNPIEPRYKKTKNQILKTFKTTDRKELAKIVFNNKSKLKKLNKIMKKPMQVLLRKELKGKKGLILINAALLPELNLLTLCNNNIILVKSNRSLQEKRLKKRGLNNQQINQRLNSQLTFEKKKQLVESSIKKHNHGRLFILENNPTKILKKINKLFK